MAEGTARSFSPEMVAVINKAYEEGVDRLGLQNSHSERRALLGRFVVELAQAGETNSERLRNAAVAAVKRFDWIRHQAHEIWESEGRPHGRHEAHWAQAEQEFEISKGELD